MKNIWTDACQKEFDYLKSSLMSEPILVALDSNKDFVIVCDAARTGLGWTILQRQDDGNLHVVSYGGVATTEGQQKWTAAQLEICAVASALKSFEAYFFTP